MQVRLINDITQMRAQTQKEECTGNGLDPCYARPVFLKKKQKDRTVFFFFFFPLKPIPTPPFPHPVFFLITINIKLIQIFL